jgi:plastocyanin
MVARSLLIVLAVVAASGGDAREQGTGAVAGRVRYVGRLPNPVYVFESGKTQSIMTLDASQGLAGAVVSVDADPVGPDATAPEVTINQRNWWFTPGVIAVHAGQPVRFTNEDSSNHSVRSTTGVPANRFSTYTGTGQPYVHRFRVNPDGSPAVLTCDIHAWMMAWVYVFDHPHFAMTDATGSFSIPDVAARTYRLSVKHGPSGLSRVVDVTVAPNKPTRIDVAFDTADLNLPGR